MLPCCGDSPYWKTQSLLSIFKCTTVVGSIHWNHRQTRRKEYRVRNELFCLGKKLKRGGIARARTQKYCFLLTTKENFPDAWSKVSIDVKFIGTNSIETPLFPVHSMLSRETLDIFILVVFSLDLWHRGLISVWKTKMEELSPTKNNAHNLVIWVFIVFWLNSYFICFLLIPRCQMIWKGKQRVHSSWGITYESFY